MRFGQTKLPGHTRVHDARNRRCAGSAIVATDEHNIGMSLGYTGSNGTDANRRNKLDVDTRNRVCIFKIVDKLRQIFN